MILSEYPSNINSRFYAFNDKPRDNVELTEFISGRIVGYQRNTKKQMEFNCKIKLSVKKELPLFWTWFNDVLGQTAGAFTCSAIGSGTYRFTAVPEPEDTDLQYRVLNLSIQEL